MQLGDSHREILGMRSYLNKFAIQVGFMSPLTYAVDDLVDEGYVRKIDTCYLAAAGGKLMNVYQLTEAGVALVDRENIEAVSP